MDCQEGITTSLQTGDFRWLLSVISSVLCTGSLALSRGPCFAVTTRSQSRRRANTPARSQFPLLCCLPTAKPIATEPLSALQPSSADRLPPPPPRDSGGEERQAENMDVNIAPLRAWDDFFPGSDRFARPDFRDISKWNNRVVSNLLYYQTNYLVVAAMMISVVG